jgi:hypothetical protein
MPFFSALDAGRTLNASEKKISERPCRETPARGRFFVWVGRWRDVQGQRARVLGRCAAMTKGDADGRRTWKESSRPTTEPRMLHHLFSRFGERLIQTITREQMQAFLEEKAGTCSRSTVDHLRWDLNATCKLAISDGVMPFDPAAELRSPRRRS